ncbi:hydroxyethylthiazole kinase [Ruminiclostridium sufflavum DSM 19573]|uniref:Hydroxyethylthiazole kinase n=1 Tax=Ruminiclostridium sufflavum DSM 19573 TaxID=1121337 RepID=A0A318XMI8_9FIRM|nr:hydroxyethylthiazole kinase [Ruminiclostridium sufflavum]PYG89072.1 hydroxyethylthiazole kinase [Ruminiclostridium sufflavum DSM 19573]
MFEDIMENIIVKHPLVHCITNYVTVNDVANVLLACGASPIMADDEKEAEEITSICTALNINIGTLNSRTVKSMLAAGKKANELSHTVVLDPVGAGASAFRTKTTFELLEKVKFSVIRGNISEIKTVDKGCGTTQGVDADVSDAVTDENLEEAVAFAKGLSRKTGAVIVITGAIDIAADSEKAYVIRNGNPAMSKVTGTGCMLSGMVAAFAGANKGKTLLAATAAVCTMGLAGELAFKRIEEEDKGTSTLRAYIIDEISRMTAGRLEGGARIEVK